MISGWLAAVLLSTDGSFQSFGCYFRKEIAVSSKQVLQQTLRLVMPRRQSLATIIYDCVYV